MIHSSFEEHLSSNSSELPLCEINNQNASVAFKTNDQYLFNRVMNDCKDSVLFANGKTNHFLQVPHDFLRNNEGSLLLLGQSYKLIQTPASMMWVKMLPKCTDEFYVWCVMSFRTRKERSLLCLGHCTCSSRHLHIRWGKNAAMMQRQFRTVMRDFMRRHIQNLIAMKR